jgi:hypothetical protein
MSKEDPEDFKKRKEEFYKKNSFLKDLLSQITLEFFLFKNKLESILTEKILSLHKINVNLLKY